MLPQLLVRQHSVESLSKSVGVRLNEERSIGAYLRKGSAARCHDRNAAGHPFESRKPEALVQRRDDDSCACSTEPSNCVRRLVTEQADSGQAAERLGTARVRRSAKN
jgi:hypothetical protein